MLIYYVKVIIYGIVACIGIYIMGIVLLKYLVTGVI